MVPQFTDQHLPEVVSHEEVKDRVDGTVQKGQRPSHDIEGVDDDLSAPGLLPAAQARSNPHVAHDMVGRKKHREDHNCHDD